MAFLLPVVVMSLLIPSSRAEVVCNGHGIFNNSSGGSCECEQPYSGVDCELCTDHFFGDPQNGNPCYLGCSAGFKLLSGFSSAGVGIENKWLQTSAVERFCIWVVSPSSDAATHIFQNQNSTAHVFPDFEMVLQFRSTRYTSCQAETVLVYKGLPEYLYSEIYPSSESEVTQDLVASFTGEDLLNGSLTVTSPIITIVYHHATEEAVGFNVTIAATVHIATSQPEPSTPCSTDTDLLCNCTHSGTIPSYCTLIPDAISSSGNTSQDYLSEACTGYYHHSVLYDPCSDSLWLYGGRDLAGRLCYEITAVHLSSSEVDTLIPLNGTGPVGRYLHSAIIIPCSSNSSSSQMLVFGGITSGLQLNRELWLFSEGLWKQLNSPEMKFMLAGHSAVLVGGANMIVIGGVRTGQHISPYVLQYDLSTDTWEILNTGALGPVGLYGHSAVYDSDTNTVLVFGGFESVRPSPVISSTLYSLDINTLRWSIVQLASETPSRIFHSAVLSGGYLVVYGGLLGSRSGGGEELCATSGFTLVLLETNCKGKPVANIQGGEIDGNLPSLWGHQSVGVGNYTIITGGHNGTTTVGSVATLWVPNPVECTLIHDPEECLNIPNCVLCHSNTSIFQPTCYNQIQPGLICENPISNETSPCIPDVTCSQFRSCRECLVTDVAQSSDCVWCSCDSTCVSALAQGSCSCETSDIDQSDICFLDVCQSPSCDDCTNALGCHWISNNITQVPSKHNQIFVSDSPVEWGCYSDLVYETLNIHGFASTAVEQCPITCSQATSCTECVNLNNTNAGNLTCVWASYGELCLSADVIPLLCSDGMCGAILSAEEECPSPCSNHSDCPSCLQNVRCKWNSEVGYCTHIKSGIGPSDFSYYQCPHHDECNATNHVCSRPEQVCVDKVHGFECQCIEGYTERDSQCVPQCPADCNGNGLCVSPNNCSCNLGYTGEYCSLECYCNGHSDCLDATESGRRICLECKHNTQGFLCAQCQRFFVGSPTSGEGCIPCSEYCHGNSDICLTNTEYETFTEENITLESTVLSTHISSGPTKEDAVCVNCMDHSIGPTCSTCLDGYFNLSGQIDTVVCTECRCNGHGDTCNPVTGEECECHNNTLTTLEPFVPHYDSQCNSCVEGYHGNPFNNSHCYKEHFINTLYNYTVETNQSLFLGVPPTHLLYSDIDLRVTLDVERGFIDAYITSDAKAVQVTVGEYGEHVVSLKPGVILVEKGSAKSYVTNAGPTGSDFTYHSSTKHKVVVTIPSSSPSFQYEWHYITVFAQSESKFYFYYRQDPPRLNLIVFFGVFLSCFSFAACITVLVWNIIRAIYSWRTSHRVVQEQHVRASRPFGSVMVYFDGSSIPYDSISDISMKDHSMGEIICSKPDIETIRLDNLQSHGKQSGTTDQSECAIAIQPLKDGKAFVNTVLIKLPSRGIRLNTVCTGSTLLEYSRDRDLVKRRKRWTNKCTPPTAETAATEF